MKDAAIHVGQLPGAPKKHRDNQRAPQLSLYWTKDNKLINKHQIFVLEKKMKAFEQY